MLLINIIIETKKIYELTFRNIGDNNPNQKYGRVQPRISHAYGNNKEKDAKENGNPRNDGDEMVHFSGNWGLLTKNCEIVLCCKNLT